MSALSWSWPSGSRLALHSENSAMDFNFLQGFVTGALVMLFLLAYWGSF